MRVRQFELRLLATTLTILWAVSGLIVLVAYRPGGPVDIFVGVAASLPLAVSLASVLWPPLVRSTRGAAGVFWLGLGAGLLLMPSIAGIAGQVVAGGTEPVLPSIELVYPWVLALLATSLFAGLGISRQLIPEVGIGRRRLAASVAFALAATTVIGGVFAGVSLADASALRDRPTSHSRFGPTSLDLVPPLCTVEVIEAGTASIEMQLWGDVDSRAVGTVSLTGSRAGKDFSWTAQVVRSDLFGDYGAARLGSQAWRRTPDDGWKPAPAADVASDALDDTVLADALSLPNRATAEDRGFEYVEGARARHCRVAVDGLTFAASFPQMEWLVGDTNVKAWRGQIDFWLFGDGELGRVEGLVNGAAGTILPHGLLATMEVLMTATDRGSPVSISPPR